MAFIPLSALSAADVAFDVDGVSAWRILLAAEQIMIQESQNSQLKTLLVGVRVTEYAAATMAMLQMFDFDFHSLLGSGANSLRNVVSMDAELHDEWDDLAFWFEEVDGKPNTYDVVAAGPSFWTMVTFTVDPDFAADRGLLAIRAAVSRVAHMSGAAEQYEIIMRDRETSTVMAHDGSSAEFLKRSLRFRP
ncbi:hypothetical protein B0H13DRAFT_2049807, partial [Mycena leptocephala]